ncbi:MAG: indole-3-glycerol phosphate synthase [Candidatus Magnetoglobus multicellularis str. Araruama]|uniref:Indole-3-glycerol phosphate synthase n=1 Tax=Candidatus Magnetoglobus multicellularis str. Araruama TaxID=890399 RepID=A0A1V1P2U6_9BACT|nr:MAG: indole-3-glycerol phosphate synthase [Candidatus Magnetoglobus multicellularis str. Araruama]
MTILNKILKKNTQAVALLKSRTTEIQLEAIANKQPPARSLVKVIQSCQHVPVIAEIKKASPSRGTILADADIVDIARQYQKGGAVAISVLTESDFFNGSIDDLKTVRQAVDILVLRKDFIIDPIQVLEARAGGADSVLLIAAALEFDKLQSLYDLCLDLGMIPLVEVHNSDELTTVMQLHPQLIGINNRNLKTMAVDIQTSANLRQTIPDTVCVVGESGVSSPDHVDYLQKAGINAFLIGTALMTSGHPQETLKILNGLKKL